MPSPAEMKKHAETLPALEKSKYATIVKATPQAWILATPESVRAVKKLLGR